MVDVVTLALAKKYTDSHITSVYRAKGSCNFADLPTSGQAQGDVWQVLDDFVLGGKSYPAGTNVFWNGSGWSAMKERMVVTIADDLITDSSTTALSAKQGKNLKTMVDGKVDSPVSTALDGDCLRKISGANTWAPIDFSDLQGMPRDNYFLAQELDAAAAGSVQGATFNEGGFPLLVQDKILIIPIGHMMGDLVRLDFEVNDGEFIRWKDGHFGGELVPASLTPKGSCTHAALPVAFNQLGDMWNLTDSGIYGPAGTNVYWTDSNMWSPLTLSFDASAYELVARKVTNVITPEQTDHVKYPSAKAVQDALELKVSEPTAPGTAGQVLTINETATARIWQTVDIPVKDVKLDTLSIVDSDGVANVESGNASGKLVKLGGAIAPHEVIQWDGSKFCTRSMSGVYTYKGQVLTYGTLPTEGMVPGDTYDVIEAHGEYPPYTDYAWNGSAWNALGGDGTLYEKLGSKHKSTDSWATDKGSDVRYPSMKATDDQLELRVPKSSTGAAGTSSIHNLDTDAGTIIKAQRADASEVATIKTSIVSGQDMMIQLCDKLAASGEGARIALDKDGAYYTSGHTNDAYTADDEIATKGHIVMSTSAPTSGAVIAKAMTVGGTEYDLDGAYKITASHGVKRTADDIAMDKAIVTAIGSLTAAADKLTINYTRYDNGTNVDEGKTLDIPAYDGTNAGLLTKTLHDAKVSMPSVAWAAGDVLRIGDSGTYWNSKKDYLGFSIIHLTLNGIDVHVQKTGLICIASFEGSPIDAAVHELELDTKYFASWGVPAMIVDTYGTGSKPRMVWIYCQKLYIGDCPAGLGANYRGELVWIANSDVL